MKYFESCATLDELKHEYRRLALLYHPDLGGDEETMKSINDAHDARFEALKRSHNVSADEEHQTTETAEEFRDILAILFALHGLDIELCGAWLWIGGDTKANKEALKSAGCRWSGTKKLWYWHHQEASRPWHRGKSSMGAIRNKYGSERITAATDRAAIA